MDDTAPTLAEAPNLPVTTGTILLCVALFLFIDDRSADAVILDIRAFENEPWRLVTSCLLHGDLFHLGFNLVFLWRLGSLIEHRLGHGRLGILMVLFGAVPAAAEYALNTTAIGLSGVVYGLFTFTWVLSVTVPSFRGSVDRYTIGVFIAWFFLAVGLTELGLMKIANVAHGVGALSGALMGWAMALLDWRRWASGVAMMVLTILTLLGATYARPMVNLSRFPGIDSALLGEVAYQEGNFGLAAHRYEQATSYRSVDADFWFNLGLSYERLERPEQALSAYAEALSLEPEHEKASSARARLLGNGAPPNAPDEASDSAPPGLETTVDPRPAGDDPLDAEGLPPPSAPSAEEAN